MKNLQKTIGLRLKLFRNKHFKLNQTKMAAFLDTNQTTLSKYEKGENAIPDSIKLILIENGLNPAWLLTGEGEMLLDNIPKTEPTTQQDTQLFLEFEKAVETLIDTSTAPKFGAVDERLNDIQEQIEALKKAQQNPHSGDLIYENPPSYSSSLVDDYEEEEPTIPIAYAEHLAAGKPSQAYETGETYLVRQSLIKGNPANYYAVRISGSSMTQAGIKDGAVVLLQKCQEAKASAIMVVRYRDNTTLKRLSQDKDNWHLSYEDGTNRIIKLYKGEWSVIAEFIAVVG